MNFGDPFRNMTEEERRRVRAMTDEERRQFNTFRSLPSSLQDWWNKKVFLAYTMAGREPAYVEAWFKLSLQARWKLIGYLVAESVSPASLAVPIIKQLPPQVKSANIPIAVSVNQFDDSTDKVKHILMTWQNVRLVGMRGSGKTSKARWICQYRAKNGQKVYWVNPHLSHQDKVLLESLGVIIVGGGRDYEAIARFCNDFCEGENSVLNKEYIRYNSEPNAVFDAETIVLDELTNYKEQVGAPILTFVKASVQEFSKINRSVIYITHNTTLSCMGAPDGFAQAIKDNLFDLKLEADPMQGNRVPKEIAKYRMPNSDDWHNVKIPVEWQ